MDPNYWGLWCVPLGLVICFAPALIAAAMTTEVKDPTEKDVHTKYESKRGG